MYAGLVAVLLGVPGSLLEDMVLADRQRLGVTLAIWAGGAVVMAELWPVRDPAPPPAGRP